MTELKVPVTVQGCKLIYRNFSGRQGPFNPEGARNFNVVLTEEEGEALLAQGWNVKWMEPREEGDVRQGKLKVNVKFGGKGPPLRIILITSRGKTTLTEDMVTLLDWADIIDVDLIFRPYNYNHSGRQGVSAYLKAIYVTIQEDPLEIKYADMPDTDSALSIVTADAQPEEAPF